MKIETLHLVNFRGIHEMTLNFHPKMNVLVGVNGAGKSSLLDAMAMLLTRMVSMIRSGINAGKDISLSDVSAGRKYSHLVSILSEKDERYAWALTRYLPHTPKLPELDNLPEGTLKLRKFTSVIRDEIDRTLENCSIPVLTYFRAERVALNFPRFVHTDQDFSLLSVYRDSLSNKADYRVLLEWFRERENAEDREFKRRMLESKSGKTPEVYRDPQLNVVRRVWKAFLPEFSGFTIMTNPLRLEAQKKGTAFRVDQLSDGEKSLIALVGDMARRLAIANPTLPDPLQGEGIVLIDEIDLHFHPKRQSMIVSQLMEVFPNCQFIVATHSPQILGHVHADSIFLLEENDEGVIELRRPEESYGMTSDQILEDVMQVPSRDENEEKKLLKVFELIERRKLSEAKALIEEIRQYRRSEPKLVAADVRIHCLETMAEKRAPKP